MYASPPPQSIYGWHRDIDWIERPDKNGLKTCEGFLKNAVRAEEETWPSLTPFAFDRA
jgi:hypothetical protein